MPAALERSHFSVSLLETQPLSDGSAFVLFFVRNPLNPERSDFQKHMVPRLHIEHLAVGFPTEAGGHCLKY